MIVLYDGDCGFCRWAMAWVLRLDRGDRLIAVPIQSPLGSELLVDLAQGDRLAAAHVVAEDGSRRSGGAAAAAVLGAIDRTRVLSGLAHSLPRATDSLYAAVATRRMSLGRLVGQQARRRADLLLQGSGVTTAAELEARSRRSQA